MTREYNYRKYTREITPDALTRLKSTTDDATQDIHYLQKDIVRSKKEIKVRSIVGIAGVIGYSALYFIDNHYFNGQLDKIHPQQHALYFISTFVAMVLGVGALFTINDYFRQRKNKDCLTTLVNDATTEINRLEELLSPVLDSDEWTQITTEHTATTQAISDELATLEKQREETLRSISERTHTLDRQNIDIENNYSRAFNELLRKHHPNAAEELTYQHITRDW